MTANSQVIPQRTKWPQNSLGKKVVCSTDTTPTVVCERKDSSMSDVFIILLRVPSSSLVFFPSEASTIYSTTAPQTSSSCRQASSYFQELWSPMSHSFVYQYPCRCHHSSPWSSHRRGWGRCWELGAVQWFPIQIEDTCLQSCGIWGNQTTSKLVWLHRAQYPQFWYCW